jgi:hypothetical protein
MEEALMAEQDLEKRELTDEELEAEGTTDLPDREAMSLINANLAAPVNAAVAANILSDDSTATASATQNVDIDQST